MTTVARFEAGSIAPALAPAGGRRLSFNSAEEEINELRRQQGAQVLAGCEQGASIGGQAKIEDN